MVRHLQDSLKNRVPHSLFDESGLGQNWMLTNTAPRIPTLVKTMVSSRIHVTMLATDDGGVDTSPSNDGFCRTTF